MQWKFSESGSLHCFSRGMTLICPIFRDHRNCFCNSVNIWKYEWNKEEFRRQQYFMIIRDAREREREVEISSLQPSITIKLLHWLMAVVAITNGLWMSIVTALWSCVFKPTVAAMLYSDIAISLMARHTYRERYCRARKYCCSRSLCSRSFFR